jgi:hypothetical protein
MPTEVLDKGTDIIAGDGGGSDRKIQPYALTHGRERDGAGHRQTVVAVPTSVDRRLALGYQVRRTVGWSMKPR